MSPRTVLTRFPDELVEDRTLSDFAIRLYAWTVAWLELHPGRVATVPRAAQALKRHQEKIRRTYRELERAGWALPVETLGWAADPPAPPGSPGATGD